ncbi:MAG: histidine phosphatase family protein [Caldicoprobacterales bacterium]|mgnify:CR=1 FL=1|nr:histidine phosphatase family protein [Clostridiales bacterium]
MLLYLTRHGETQWNRLGKTQGIKDTNLTDFGRSQALKLGKYLKKNKNINNIYCSDLLRAKETAEIIGNKISIKPISSPLLREVSFGCWEGLSIHEIEKKFPGQLAKWRNELTFAPEGGESLLSVHDRIVSFLNMIKVKHQNNNDNILIVSHAATTKIIILCLTGIPLNLLTHFKISQASLSLLNIQKDRNSIVYLNDTCHLE